MTLTTTRVPRRTLLIGLMGIFTIGNLLSAIATDYTMLMLARIVTSLNHGAFFGVGSVVAASVVAPDKRAGAVAAMFMGLFAFTMHWPAVAAVTIFLWGVASFAIVAPLQMRVMKEASDAPNLASAMNIGAFNLGNAVGVALGGAVISNGLGYPAVSLAGAAMSAIGLGMTLVARRNAKQSGSDLAAAECVGVR